MRTRVVERTTTVSGVIAELHGKWGTTSKEEAVADIEDGKFAYRVKDGRMLEVVHASKPYVRSTADGLPLNNLLSLPQEPRVVIVQPYYGQHFRKDSKIHFEVEARDASGDRNRTLLTLVAGRVGRARTRGNRSGHLGDLGL